MNTDHSVGIAGGGGRRQKGINGDRDLTWGSKHNVLRNCSPETCWILLNKERILILLNLNSYRFIYLLFCVSNGQRAQYFCVRPGETHLYLLGFWDESPFQWSRVIIWKSDSHCFSPGYLPDIFWMINAMSSQAKIRIFENFNLTVSLTASQYFEILLMRWAVTSVRVKLSISASGKSLLLSKPIFSKWTMQHITKWYMGRKSISQVKL